MARKKRQAQPPGSRTNTPVWAMGLIVLCTVLIAAAQVLMKMSLNNTSSVLGLVVYPLFIPGLLLGVAVGFLLTFTLKHGELSVLHPFIAVGFIWVTLASIFVVGETVSFTNIIGVAAIVAGVCMIGGKQ
ncbi:MAG: hypothetical protein OXR66_08465 [Candidatus Woesearchaeota archaeon]|nr:hypothetical protein [Candidatus Woesearchaeota archaeon]